MRVLRLLCLWLCCLPALAGTLTQADVQRRFAAPLQVGARDAALPVWPVFKQNGTATELVGYVFESIDFAAIPGFAGVPMNLLVAIDPKGSFIDVTVLSQHEPVFLDGLGEEPLRQFVAQYQGVSLRQNIVVGGPARAGDSATAQLDGVSKATASVRILNQSVLAGALQVARGKLGFAPGRDPGQIARINPAADAAPGLQPLLHLRVSNREAEQLFKGSAAEGLDPAAPDDAFIDLHLAWVSVPAVAHALLAPASRDRLFARLEDGDHAMLVISRGRHAIIGDDFVRGSVSDRLLLRQDGLPIDMRDLDLDLRLLPGWPEGSVAVLRIIGQAGLDPARPLEFVLPLLRKKGIVYPELIKREVLLRYQLPPDYIIAPPASDQSWLGLWQARKEELFVLALALALLAAALTLQRRVVWFRYGFLLFTAGFIGYYAQGQLSIVNLTGVVQALAAGRSLSYLLFDPVSLLLWGFVLVSLLLWGRGTFCGWLCPFGALQEFSALLGRWLRLPQILIRTRLDARLKLLKYAVLAIILGSALLLPAATDFLVEIEPFKTAITLNFVRAWPYVLFAAALLGLSMVSFKFFCRYLCPLGAALALLGRLRLLDWIARRSQCGTPCQTCRHSCQYQAIKPTGAISYDECFQCLDCVDIYESADKCAPLLLEKKRARTIAIIPTDAH